MLARRFSTLDHLMGGRISEPSATTIADTGKSREWGARGLYITACIARPPVSEPPLSRSTRRRILPPSGCAARKIARPRQIALQEDGDDSDRIVRRFQHTDAIFGRERLLDLAAAAKDGDAFIAASEGPTPPSSPVGVSSLGEGLMQ
jgi:hypothetical protein